MAALLLPVATVGLLGIGLVQLLAFVGGLLTVFAVLTIALNALNGSRGEAWHLLTAGAMVAIIVPLIVFLALQRFFVRGLLAGSVKG